ncbi:hypothetical protein J0910_04560 [Nocardiopsis sp. CNT-189]|uniref:hypothetical protein n=1 Tax=Nocardiopsis oceanisediminis TaxID=2816862 RepID=UPI003B2945B1
MFGRITRVLRQPWARGLSPVVLAGAFLFLFICHVESAPAFPGQGAAAVAEAVVADGGHGHLGDAHCNDGGLLGADHRTGAVQLAVAVLLGLLPLSMVWAGPPPGGGRVRFLRRSPVPLAGSRLLLSLCVIRV